MDFTCLPLISLPDTANFRADCSSLLPDVADVEIIDDRQSRLALINRSPERLSAEFCSDSERARSDCVRGCLLTDGNRTESLHPPFRQFKTDVLYGADVAVNLQERSALLFTVRKRRWNLAAVSCKAAAPSAQVGM